MFFTFVPRKPDGFIKVFHILMWLGLHRVGVALFYIGLQNRGGICRRGRPMCLPEEITTQWLGAVARMCSIVYSGPHTFMLLDLQKLHIQLCVVLFYGKISVMG